MAEWRTMAALERLVHALPDVAAKLKADMGEADWLALQRRWGMSAISQS